MSQVTSCFLAATNVHQHESICIEKASEYMVGQSKEQKGRHRHHHRYIPNNSKRWMIVNSIQEVFEKSHVTS